MKRHFCKYPIQNDTWLLEVTRCKQYYTVMLHYKNKMVYSWWVSYAHNYIELIVFNWVVLSTWQSGK